VPARGGWFQPMILPKEAVQQLQSMEKKTAKDGVMGAAEVGAQLWQDTLTKWKAWILLNPLGLVPYKARNIMGDTEAVIGGAPGVLKFAAQAEKLLREYHYKDRAEMNPLIERALELGVIGGSIDDIGKLPNDPMFARFREQSGSLAKVPMNLVNKTSRNIVKFNSYSEEVLRLAAFQYYLQKLKSGKLTHFGGAKPNVVKKIQKDLSQDHAAAHLARKLLGDYGDISVVGRFLARSHVPFWRFQEINAGRTPRMVMNAFRSGNYKMLAPLVAAQVFHQYALQQVWNWMRPGDDDDEHMEDDVPSGIRSMPHINFWYDDDGRVMVFTNTSVVGEAMEWVNGNELPALTRQVMDGQIGVTELMASVPKAAFNKIINSANPFYSATYTAFSGKATFPDAFNQRRADRWEGFKSMGGMPLRELGREAYGRMLKTGDRAKYGGLQDAQFWQRLGGVSAYDPDRHAMYEIRNLQDQYLEKHGTEVESPGHRSKFKTMRDATFSTDFEAFKEAKATYLAKHADASYESFLQHVKRQGPDSWKNEAVRKDFEENFLNDSQRNRLSAARRFAERMKPQMIEYWHNAGGDTEAITAETEDKVQRLLVTATRDWRAVQRKKRPDARNTVNKAFEELKLMGVNQKDAVEQLKKKIRKDGGAYETYQDRRSRLKAMYRNQ